MICPFQYNLRTKYLKATLISNFLKTRVFFFEVLYMKKKDKKKRKPWGEEAGDFEEDWEDHSDYEEDEDDDDDDDDDEEWDEEDEEDWDGNDDDWDDDY